MVFNTLLQEDRNMPTAQLTTLDLSKRLRELMLSENLTVNDLAVAAGVSKSAMEKYLAGPSSPRATAIANICMTYSVSPAYLLFGQAEHDEVAEAVAFTTSFREHATKLLKGIRNDPELRALYIEADPSSERWRSTFEYKLSYTTAKSAWFDFKDYRGTIGVGAAMPIDQKAD